MPISPAEFASALPALRPRLTAIAAKRANCQTADAEDYVSESIRLALLILPQFRAPEHLNTEHLKAALAGWLSRILCIVIMRSREKRARSVETVPLESIAEEPAPVPSVPLRVTILRKIAELPLRHRDLVRDWFDGWTHQQLATAYRIHRHTVANRLNAGFQQLRLSTQGLIDFRSSDFDACRRVSVYRRPIGVFPSWRHNHPPERRFTNLHQSASTLTNTGDTSK